MLLARSLKLTMRNRTALFLLLLQAPLLGLLIGLTTSGSASFRAGTFGCTDTPDHVEYCDAASQDIMSCDSARVSSALRSHMA